MSGLKVTRIATAGQELGSGYALDATYAGDDADIVSGLPLDGLLDVNAPAPDDNDVLTWDDAAGEWIATPGSGVWGPDVELVTVAATGATETIDVSVARTYDLTLTADCTLTLTGAVGGEAWFVTLLLRQDGTGGWDVTWPGSVEWATGGAPTIDPAVNALTVVTLGTVDGGTVWLGFPTGGGSGATTLDALTDVDTSGKADQDILTWDLGTTTWVAASAPSGSGIAATLLDAKGDLIVASAADTAARLAVGSNTHVLTANSGATLGVEWAAPAASGGGGYDLDTYSIDGTYGDDFTGASLSGSWTRRNYTSGAETYQVGKNATYLRIAKTGRAVGDGYFRTAPAGDWTFAMASVLRFYNFNGAPSWGIAVVDTNGTGLGTVFYRNTPVAPLLAQITTYTTYGGGYVQPGGAGSSPNISIWTDHMVYLEQKAWVYLRKSGTDYYTAYSLDGEVWSPESAAIAWAGTVDRIGMMDVPLGLATSGNGTGSFVDVDWFNKIA